MGNVRSSEQGSFSIPNGSLLLSGLGQGPSGRAIRTHDLEQTLRARFGRPLPDVSGTGARGPFPAVAPPITLQLAGWWASPYLGRKGAIPGEADWTRGRRRGSSPPPKLADTGEAVWESGERREAGVPCIDARLVCRRGVGASCQDHEEVRPWRSNALHSAPSRLTERPMNTT